MPKDTFVDFKAIKAAVTMEQVLIHYELLDRFKRSGNSLSGPCPIHGGENPTQFRVSISKNVWNCFSKCKCGGNTLDFISKMEKSSVHAAALKAIEWFDLHAIPKISDEDSHDAVTESERTSLPEKSVHAKAPANPVLKFRLDKLQGDHPYLLERDISLETIASFGIGFCAKGMMAGRVAIPIRNVEGGIVAYAGRCVGEPEEDSPRYKLPPGFKKAQEVFNLDRARNEPEEAPLVIVEGFFDCMKIHQNGHRKVIALMGSSMSETQETSIRQYFTNGSRVIVMLDENEAGIAGRDDIACRLAKHCFVKIHLFDSPDMEPESLTAEELSAILG